MNRSRRHAWRSPLLLMSLISLAACSSWQHLDTPFEESLANANPGTVRITTAAGTVLTVKQPECRGDSVVGLVEGPSYWERGDLKHSVSPGGIPIDEVRSIEEHHANVAGTVGATLGAGMLLLGLIGSAQIAAQGGIM